MTVTLGDIALDLADPLTAAALGGAALALLLLALVLSAALRAGRAARRAAELAAEVAALRAAQGSGVQAMEHRLAALSETMGESLTGAATRTAQSLGELRERLAAIDRAQANIEKLSGDVLSLQDILSNKQTRGAFGEIQLHDILTKALPPDVIRWQATLPNGTRADCVIDLPDPLGPLVVDAKFPLEPYEALVAAETDAERRAAARDFRTALRRHIGAIAEKYVLPGETADGALMFLPSEAVYAELHARFGDVVREGFARRVWIVSPTTCMAVLNTLRAVLKDARMREQAGAIRATLRLLHRDVEQVSQRVGKLRTHFAQAQGDLEGIATAAERAAGRATRLESFEFEEQGPADPPKSGVRIVRP